MNSQLFMASLSFISGSIVGLNFRLKKEKPQHEIKFKDNKWQIKRNYQKVIRDEVITKKIDQEQFILIDDKKINEFLSDSKKFVYSKNFY